MSSSTNTTIDTSIWTPHALQCLSLLPESEFTSILKQLDQSTREWVFYNTIAKYPPAWVDTKDLVDLDDVLTGYELKKAKASQRRRMLTVSGRDIGEIPDVVDRDRREACRHDFKLDCETYHAEKFYLGWSDDHLELVDLLQRAMLGDCSSEKVVVAMPRGSGKTTLCIRAIEWAIRHGHRRYPFLVTAENDAFLRHLAGVKTTFETKQILLDDFPELCYPIRCLNRSPQAARGQTCMGESTYIEWGTDRVCFPTNYRTLEEGNGSSVIGGCGILAGKIRGQQHTTPAGEIVRPDVALFDDPQTRESAKSPTQTKERIDVMRGDVKYMKAPGSQMAMLAAVTVIQKADMADQMLGEAFPDWTPIRVAFIKQWPTNMKLWHRYGEIIRLCGVETRPITEALKFYKSNREAMDEGAIVYWKDRVDPPFQSALQTAMTAWCLDPDAMMAEWQNDPVDPHKVLDVIYLDAATIAKKTCNLQRFEVPQEATELVAFIDIQLEVLIYVVAAFSDNYCGNIVDYGTWPEQARAYWTLDSLTNRISTEIEGEFAARMLQAIRNGVGMLSHRNYLKPNNQVVPMSIGLIDAGWGDSRDLVYKFCREEGGGIWFPDVGVGISARSKPINESFKPELGEKMGPYWQLRNDPERAFSGYRHDANHYKTLVHRFFAAPELSPCSYTLFEGSHELFSHHLRAEFPEKTHGRGRDVTEWKLRPGERNDLFDGASGCLVGASICGIAMPGTEGMYGGLDDLPPPEHYEDFTR